MAYNRKSLIDMQAKVAPLSGRPKKVTTPEDELLMQAFAQNNPEVEYRGVTGPGLESPLFAPDDIAVGLAPLALSSGRKSLMGAAEAIKGISNFPAEVRAGYDYGKQRALEGIASILTPYAKQQAVVDKMVAGEGGDILRPFTKKAEESLTNQIAAIKAQLDSGVPSVEINPDLLERFFPTYTKVARKKAVPVEGTAGKRALPSFEVDYGKPQVAISTQTQGNLGLTQLERNDPNLVKNVLPDGRVFYSETPTRIIPEDVPVASPSEGIQASFFPEDKSYNVQAFTDEPIPRLMDAQSTWEWSRKGGLIENRKPIMESVLEKGIPDQVVPNANANFAFQQEQLGLPLEKPGTYSLNKMDAPATQIVPITPTDLPNQVQLGLPLTENIPSNLDRIQIRPSRAADIMTLLGKVAYSPSAPRRMGRAVSNKAVPKTDEFAREAKQVRDIIRGKVSEKAPELEPLYQKLAGSVDSDGLGDRAGLIGLRDFLRGKNEINPRKLVGKGVMSENYDTLKAIEKETGVPLAEKVLEQEALGSLATQQATSGLIQNPQVNRDLMSALFNSVRRKSTELGSKAYNKLMTESIPKATARSSASEEAFLRAAQTPASRSQIAASAAIPAFARQQALQSGPFTTQEESLSVAGQIQKPVENEIVQMFYQMSDDELSQLTDEELAKIQQLIEQGR